MTLNCLAQRASKNFHIMQCILTFAWSGKKNCRPFGPEYFFSAFFRAGIFFLQILPAPFPHKKGELVAVEPIFLRREMVITSYVQYIYINTMRFSLCRFKFGPPLPFFQSLFWISIMATSFNINRTVFEKRGEGRMLEKLFINL